MITVYWLIIFTVVLALNVIVDLILSDLEDNMKINCILRILREEELERSRNTWVVS